MNIQGFAGRAIVVGGVCLAIGAPTAAARPLIDQPMHTATPAPVAVVSHPMPAPQVRRLINDDRGGLDRPVAPAPTPAQRAATGGFDWVAVAIAGAAFAGVVGLICLAAARISRVTRPRIAHH